MTDVLISLLIQIKFKPVVNSSQNYRFCRIDNLVIFDLRFLAIALQLLIECT